MIKIFEEEYYNRDTLRLDVISLSDIYADEGYANVDIAPRIKQNPANSTVDIDFEISKGQLASLLGTIPETLSRIFSKMSEEGLIHVEGRSITILDREGLMDK